MRHPTLEIGKVYFVDHPSAKSYVGRLIAIIDPFTVALEDASWIPSTGRFSRFMKGILDSDCEIEVCGIVAATRYDSIHEWPFPLPTESK